MLKYPIPASCKLEHPVSISELVHIRPNVSIGRFTYIMPLGNIFGGVTIGRYCSVASNVTIGATPHPIERITSHPFSYCRSHAVPPDTKLTPKTWERHAFPRPTLIGHDVWIGTNAVILQGVTVGDGAVVGAGAVVTKDIPAYGVAVGVPARVSKYRFDSDTILQFLNLKWWELEVEQLNNVDYDDIPKAIAQIRTIKECIR